VRRTEIKNHCGNRHKEEGGEFLCWTHVGGDRSLCCLGRKEKKPRTFLGEEKERIEGERSKSWQQNEKGDSRGVKKKGLKGTGGGSSAKKKSP